MARGPTRRFWFRFDERRRCTGSTGESSKARWTANRRIMFVVCGDSLLHFGRFGKSAAATEARGSGRRETDRALARPGNFRRPFG